MAGHCHDAFLNVETALAVRGLQAAGLGVAARDLQVVVNDGAGERGYGGLIASGRLFACTLRSKARACLVRRLTMSGSLAARLSLRT